MAVVGSVHLSGDGASAYQIEDEFSENGIEFQKMGFMHPTYEQIQGIEFVPGLSIIDALFNIEAEATYNLLADSR